MTEAAAAADIQATFCATLVDEWVRCGVVHAVASPGSRSTPMALALAADERITLHVHHDERSAGFVAVGIGLATGHPALVLTTSGTAAVELHPSIVEAHQSSVPVIALTADRPPELHNVGAPQTVDQVHLFGRSVRWFADPGVPDGSSAGTWRSLASRSVAEATTAPAGPGPVHLNLAFREPLVGVVGELPPGRPDGARWHTTVGRRAAVDRTGTERLSQLLDADRGVIVAGAGAGDPELVAALAGSTGWPVLADARSGCRLPGGATVAAFDAILRSSDVAAQLTPEVVLRLGEPPVSKVLSQWLAGSGAVQVAIDQHGRWFDADHLAAHVLQADPNAALQALLRLVGGRADENAAWTAGWVRAEALAQEAIDSVLEAHEEPTEPGVARSVVASMPPGSSLVVSSSMPIRDVEWFGAPRSDLRVHANRGANGIDGVISTAVGVAIANRAIGARTAVLVGDVAFLHDTNGMLGLLDRELDLTIVVVNNDGGGIFSFLPQADALGTARFEHLFGTPHAVDLSLLAAAHGMVTIEPAGAADVVTALGASTGAGGSRVVLVRTDRAANVEVHRDIEAAVTTALAAGVG